jgi:hypothetical protein
MGRTADLMWPVDELLAVMQEQEDSIENYMNENEASGKKTSIIFPKII